MSVVLGCSQDAAMDVGAIASGAPGQSAAGDFSAIRASDAPPLANPTKHSFKKWINRYFISKTRPIGHMVHDVVGLAGVAQTVVGKFAYGVTHKDLEGEYIHGYIWARGNSSWQYLGKRTTNSDGKVSYAIIAPAGEYVFKMIAEGDLSSATGFVTIVSANDPVVVFDIDGTLTPEDAPATSIVDHNEIENMSVYKDAVRLVGLYETAGYQIFYLTARPYWLARPTRKWLSKNGFTENSLRATSSNGDALSPTDYKAGQVQALQDLGLDIHRVYGNATTDIEAYNKAGIAKSDTFIIGENAGSSNTQPILDDYGAHADGVATELGL